MALFYESSMQSRTHEIAHIGCWNCPSLYLMSGHHGWFRVLVQVTSEGVLNGKYVMFLKAFIVYVLCWNFSINIYIFIPTSIEAIVLKFDTHVWFSWQFMMTAAIYNPFILLNKINYRYLLIISYVIFFYYDEWSSILHSMLATRNMYFSGSCWSFLSLTAWLKVRMMTLTTSEK